MKVLGFILTSTPTSGEVIKLSSFRFTHSIQNTKMGFHIKGSFFEFGRLVYVFAKKNGKCYSTPNQKK